MNTTGFRCIACGTGVASERGTYSCPDCAGHIEVEYDYDRAKQEIGDRRNFGAGRCDHFRFLPLLPISNLSLTSPLRVGSTPLFCASRLGEAVGLDRLYIKDEGMNPTASLKDRAGSVALAKAREVDADVIALASTGNAGSSMAGLAASVGVKCVVFVPDSAPQAKLAQLAIFGAKVLAVRGSYDDAYDLCQETCSERGWFNRNTGFNPFTREGKKTCSYEICEQLKWEVPDRVVVPTGDGNIISGIWKGFRDLFALGYIDRLPKVDCVQAQGSSAIVRALEKILAAPDPKQGMDWTAVKIESVDAVTVADSIAVDAPRDGIAAMRAVVESGGAAVSVSDEEILAAVKDLGAHSGVFAEPSAAASLAGIRKQVAGRAISADERVVCLITGSGLKDINSVQRVAKAVDVIDNSIDAVRAAVDQL